MRKSVTDVRLMLGPASISTHRGRTCWTTPTSMRYTSRPRTACTFAGRWPRSKPAPIDEGGIDNTSHTARLYYCILYREGQSLVYIQQMTVLSSIGFHVLVEKPVLARPIRVQHSQDAQQSRLARSGWPHHRDEIALGNIEIDAAKHVMSLRPRLVALLDLTQPDHQWLTSHFLAPSLGGRPRIVPTPLSH